MDIFHDKTSKIPTRDGQIIRVDMEELQIGGRKSHLPKQSSNPDLSIQHVPNAGTKV